MKIQFSENLSVFAWAHRLIDLVIPLMVLLLLFALPLSLQWDREFALAALLNGALFVLTAQVIGLYRAWRGRALNKGLKLVAQAWLLSWTILITLAFLLNEGDKLSRETLGLVASGSLLALVSYRIAIRLILTRIRRTGRYIRRVAIYGAGVIGQELAQKLQQNEWLGYQVVAFYDDFADTSTPLNGLPIWSKPENLVAHLEQNQIAELYLCLPLRAEERLKAIIDELGDSSISAKFIPDLFSFDLFHARWSELDGIPMVSVYDTPLNSQFSRIVKRGEDILLSLIILLLVSPLLLLIALSIKLTSKGPVIFKQARYGINGQRINVYKFRSMRCLENGTSVKQATSGDPRITWLGGWLRKTSLDELPQFVNVIQGKMSIVGPRPHAVAHNEEYRTLVPQYMQRHLVKPGITGWAQINGWRGETDTLEKMQKRVEYDLHYIKNWSLWLDLKIIILTLFKGFIHKNAR